MCAARVSCSAKDRSTADNGSNSGSKNLRVFSRCLSAVSRSWTTICTYSAPRPRPGPKMVKRRSRPRWGRLFPPRDRSRQPLPVSHAWIQWRLQDAQWVATARERLQSLSWFMKCLKEPLSRLANRQDNARGAFFEGRFKSVAILDEEALLATCAYIDLNPVAAGIVDVPEASPHTSITTRIEHVKEQGRLADLTTTAVAIPNGPKGAEVNSHGLQPLAPQTNHAGIAALNASSSLEESIWLCPVEDRRKVDSSREGMLEGFSLGNYVLLVEYTGRLFRDGKAVISAELEEILERIGSTAESWWARIEKLSKGRLLGRFFAASLRTPTRDRRPPGRPPSGQLRRVQRAIIDKCSAPRPRPLSAIRHPPCDRRSSIASSWSTWGRNASFLLVRPAGVPALRTRPAGVPVLR